MTVLSQIPGRPPRRGELDTALEPHARHVIREIYRELLDLRVRAEKIGDDFLTELIAAAEDEARDQLRDDLMLREGEAGEAFRARMRGE